MYLNCHTFHSLRYGVLSPGELVSRAAMMGIEALVLTDINSSSGVYDFVKACRQSGITPLAGIEFREDGRLLYTGIARNMDGFGELNRFLTRHRLAKLRLPFFAPLFESAFVIYPFDGNMPSVLRENEFIGIRRHQLNRLVTTPKELPRHRLVVWQPVVFTSRQEWEVHRHLRAIDGNVLLSHLKDTEVASPFDWLVPPLKLQDGFSSFPFIVSQTVDLLKQCSLDVDFTTVKNRKYYTGSADGDAQLLKRLAREGCERRYGVGQAEAIQRVDKELDIIFKMGFAAYFLITWDIVQYALSQNFYHVGRGSGANSVVAYCLQITDVDPIGLDLYFERFLNPKRSSPPDFDIDFSWRDRETVQRYIFERFGPDHVALLGAIVTFQKRSTVRELGKVYGLPVEEIETLSRQGFDHRNNEIAAQIFSVAEVISNFPNSRSIHAGGVLISDAPITDYTVVELPPKGLPTAQMDMYAAESIRFDKLDILSQRGIGHIRDCATIVQQNCGETIDVHDVERFKQDQRVKQLLRAGETIGCFYIESPATRGLLTKLRCDNYLTLVAASSIIRPGVAGSGMMREYIYRFHHPDKFSYAHPVMEQQLKETYGVMVYQEDVIKVCHHFAGMDLADADVLRRAMSGKYRSPSEFQVIVDRFFNNCRERGYPDDLTKEVWRQIKSFAGYSFSKAHSASYAVESFQSLYLKAHYPLEFIVAVINNFGGFYASWVYVHEARRQGGTVHLPCVNRSDYLTSIQGKDIYLGLIFIRDLEQQLALKIVDERRTNGDFKGLEDLVVRTGIGREQILLLIRVGALRFTGLSKPKLLWEVHMYLTRDKEKVAIPRLFSLPGRHYSLPQLLQQPIEDAYDEMELLGFPVTLTKFELLKTSFRGEIKAHQMLNYVGKKVRMVGELVTIKYVRTVTHKQMHFGAFLDDKGVFFDTVHFPQVSKKYPFRGDGVYLVLGTVTEEFGMPLLEVEKMAVLPLCPDPRGD